MATKIVGINCELSTEKKIDGMNYQVFASTDDGRAILRAIDTDSGMVAFFKTYPNMEMAQAEVKKAVDLVA